MSIQLSSIKPAYRILSDPGTPEERVVLAAAQRYQVVTEAEKLQRRGIPYELQKLVDGQYERDGHAHEQVFTRQNLPSRHGKLVPATPVNTELVKEFRDMSTLCQTCAQLVRKGKFNDAHSQEFTMSVFHLLNQMGMDTGTIRQLLRSQQPAQ